MGIGGDIGIHAKGDSCLAFQLCGASCECCEFRRALHIEKEYVGFERGLDLGNRLADSGKHDFFCRFAVGAQNSLKFAARDHVESGAKFSEQAENAEIRVGLHRIADCVVNAPKRNIESRNALANHFRGIDVQRSAEPVCQLG